MPKAMPNFMKKCFSSGYRPGVPGAILFFSLLAVQLGSCVEVDNTFGTEYIPDGQIMRVLRDSSMHIDTYNVTTDSVYSSGTASAYIGGYHDPLTGSRVDAGLLVQLQRFGFSTDSMYRTSPVADSAYLVLSISDVMGRSDVSQTFDLYELTEAISPDSVYYSDFDPEPIRESSPLLSFTLTGKQDEFRYDLSGHPLLARLMDTTGYTTDAGFRERFKGLYIKPREAMQDGALRLIDLSGSGVRIWYRYYVEKGDSMSTTNIASYSIYPTKDISQSVAVVRHDFSNVSPALRLDDRTVPVSRTYMQGYGGIKTYLEFSEESIAALKERVRAAGFSSLAINKAKLQVYIPARDPDSLDYHYGRLGMFYDYDNLRYIPDFNYVYEATYETELPYGGYLNRSRYLYEMDITTYVQRLFREGYEYNGVYLTPAVGTEDYSLALSSFALDGTGSAAPPLLVITYTMIR